MDKKVDVQRIAAKAIVINEKNEILILREANTYAEGTKIGKYLLPGGRIEVGEPYFEGLKREVSEETGLDVAIGEPVHVSEWFPTIKGVQNQIVAIFFSCKALSSSVKLSSEHDHYVWADPKRIKEYGIPESDFKAIENWQNKSNKQQAI